MSTLKIDEFFLKSLIFHCRRRLFLNHQSQNKWRAKHPETYRMRARISGAIWNAREKEQVKETKELILIKLGSVCSKCGFDDVRALQIDHVNGGGRKEFKAIHRRLTYYRKVLSDEGGRYQILCANCNWIKRSEDKEYGGGRPREF